MGDGYAPRILFAAGGTGGHVYPAIAIAEQIRSVRPDAALAFAGTRERLEWRVVPQSGFEITAISAAGFQRRLTLSNLLTPLTALRGLGQSMSLINAFDPDVVVGTGGFVAGPVLAAAFLLRRKTIIQEQNAFPGVTNRILGRRADEIHVAFHEAARYFPEERCTVSGNPTRAELTTATRDAAREYFGIDRDVPVLFTFGGSLGSQAMNDVLIRRWRALVENGVVLIWQTGPRYFERVRKQLHDASGVHLIEYVDRMDLAYAASDVALCRSGAITCSELLVTGTPSILVPSPNVAEDHQTKNALSLTDAGAAVMIREEDLDKTLVTTALDLLHDRPRLEEMGHRARESAHPDAASRLATAVLNLAHAHVGKTDKAQ